MHTECTKSKKYQFSQVASRYTRHTIEEHNLEQKIIDMVVNTMKLEDQEVSKADLLEKLDEGFDSSEQ
jgi:hypothetical protein